MKRIILIFLMFSLTLSMLEAALKKKGGEAPPCPPKGQTASAKIAKWLHNRAAAISITYDDGNPASPINRTVNSEVLRNGLIMDYEIVSADYLNSPFTQNYLLKKLIPAGFGYFGHGHTHINHDRLTKAEALESFRRCFKTIEAFGLHPAAYAYPQGAGLEAETRAALEEAGFLSARLHFSDKMTSPWIVPGVQNEPEDWFALPTLVMQDFSFTHCKRCVGTNEQLLPYLDHAIMEKDWIILTYHAIGDEKGYGFFKFEEFVKNLAAIRERDFWNASMNSVTLYIREKARAAVVITPLPHPGNDIREIALTLSDGLPNNIYYQPLTLILQLPESWLQHSVALMEHKIVYCRFVAGGNPVLVDIPPDEITRKLVLEELAPVDSSEQ